MLRSTHKVIAERITSELKLADENAQLFIDGLLGPDSHGDFPHDKGKDREILHKIDKARTLFLMNDDECYGQTGNALHYIQDKWVTDELHLDAGQIINDEELFEQSIDKMVKPEHFKEKYNEIAKNLFLIKNAGIESWFNLSWGFWHKDYPTTIYVFADVVELMLPTLQLNDLVRNDKEKLRMYLKSENFRKATQTAFLGSIKTNFLYPKISGYPAAVYTLASISPEPNYSNPIIDLNIAYKLSLEIARQILTPAQKSEYHDNWTQLKMNKTDAEFNRCTQMGLAYVLPEYHVLIPQNVIEIRAKRVKQFEEMKNAFLKNWRALKSNFQTEHYRSETWNILLSQLVEFLND